MKLYRVKTKDDRTIYVVAGGPCDAANLTEQAGYEIHTMTFVQNIDSFIFDANKYKLIF